MIEKNPDEISSIDLIREQKIVENTERLVVAPNINKKIYHLLKERIIHLTYPPGYRINSRQLKKELNVSQTPLKDALMRLSGEGLIEICSRSGTYVRNITAKDIREIADTRIILESGAIDTVARQITDEQLEKLRFLYKATLLDEDEFDYTQFMIRDNEFHLFIMKLANNDILYDIYNKLNAHMQIVRFKYSNRNSKKLAWTDRDHEDILNALEMRDPDRAKAAMRRHLTTARDAFLKQGSEMRKK